MNKLEKIRELKKEISYEMQEYRGCSGKSPYEILTDILSLMEDDYTTMKSSPEPCCGEYETCEKACVPRADYFKQNSRVELNKLALSILKESLKDEGYRQSWEANIAIAFCDAYHSLIGQYGACDYNDYKLIANNGAKLFMDRLFGEIKEEIVWRN